MKRIRWGVVGVVLLAAGCASPLQVPYNEEGNRQVKRIGFLDPQIDDELDVRMAVHPGGNFGLIGALVAEGDMSSKSDDFSESVTAKGYSLRRKFIAAIAKSLEDAGYEVVYIKGKRNGEGLLKSYPPDNGRADAYLDIVAGVTGYMSAGASTPYRPTIYVTCRLVSAKDGATLMQDQIYYNAFGEPKNTITISADPQYSFESFADLTAQIDAAISGMDAATQATANTLARLIH